MSMLPTVVYCALYQACPQGPEWYFSIDLNVANYCAFNYLLSPGIIICSAAQQLKRKS